MSIKILSTTIGVATLTAGITLAAPAAATYSWVEDESASICSSLYLTDSGSGDNWTTLKIQMLQLKLDIGRAEAVAGIGQAATEYCPQYLASVPTR
jgi:hypothetical protein